MDLTTMWARDYQSSEGHLVDRTYAPGFVILSLLVSYIGAWTTLELVNRRTSTKGWYNWSLLIGASISMGGIAIWSMHFIGNRAITLGGGDIDLQIMYSPGFTSLSFFVPIVVLFMAFVAVGIHDEISYVRLVLGGTLAGLGVCGMHYLGQASITNYDCIYTVAHVVGAAIVAIVASITALGMFFVFRSAWSAAWWKRALCGLILAGAVSGMHWLASVGTQYRLKKGAPPANASTREATTISVIVLAIGGCFILILVTLIAQARRIRAANRAKQVVLAALIFDKDGKILVTADGILPNQKITSSYREQNINDTFGIAHPTFLWMFRASRNWSSVTDLITPMKNHLARSGLRSRFGAESDANFVNESGTPLKDYHIVFRELFCTAAADLADDLNQPLSNLGIMYDEIIHTGQTQKPQKGKVGKARGKAVDLERDGLETGPVGKGQLLFLVQEADRQQAEQLQAAGFRFGQPSNIIPPVAATFQVTRKELTRQLEIMRIYAGENHILDPGVHLAFFAVKASIGAGFDVLARKDARNQLPTMQLPFDTVESWQVDYMRNMENFNVSTCLKHLNKAAKSAAGTEKEKTFASQLLTCLEALKDEIDDPIFNDACLVSKPVYAPCRGQTERSRPGRATLIAFRLVVPVGSRAPGKKLDFIPLAFFKMQQHVYQNSPDHAVFTRKTYREFAPVLALSGRPSVTEIAMPMSPKERKFVGGIKTMGDEDYFGAPIPHLVPKPDSRKPSLKEKIFNRRGSDAKIRGDNSSEKNLVDHISPDEHPLGGIMVSQEVDIDSNEVDRPSSPLPEDSKKRVGIQLSDIKAPQTGVFSKASIEEETESYVDELFKVCIASR